MIADNIELGNGEGTLESPKEINVLETSSVENINKLIENIKEGYNFKFVDEPKEDGENIIFKIKLQEKISFIRALFNKTSDENYIEIKVPKNNVEVVTVLKDLYKSTNEPEVKPEVKPEVLEEKPGTPEEKPGTSEEKPDTSDKKEIPVSVESSEKNNKEDDKSIPKTGGVNSLGIIGLGSTILTLGGLLTFKKKRKK